jgi:hypothetical protein
MTTAMKHFLATIFLATLCAATGYGQTMKALSYNTTNGVVAYSGADALSFNSVVKLNGLTAQTAVTFQKAIAFDDVESLDIEATTRTNLGLGATWLTNGNVTNFRNAIGLGTTNTVTFSNVVILGNVSTTNVISTATNFNVGGTLNVTNKAETRTNLGLGLPALTNDSNVTMMRALAGSTNTNQPFSGTIQFVDGNNVDIYIYVTNGIITGWAE